MVYAEDASYFWQVGGRPHGQANAQHIAKPAVDDVDGRLIELCETSSKSYYEV